MANGSTSPAVVVHIPHASLTVPSEVRDTLLISEDDLKHELLVMTDRFTDELFTVPETEAVTVAAVVSRLVVDVERFPNDQAESMSRVGMGAVYMLTSRGARLRADDVDRQALMDKYYAPHHAKLLRAVREAVAQRGRCLIIDAHSFPSVPLPHEPDQDPDRPDLCFGTDPDHTPQWLCDLAVRTAERMGWRVAVNRPFGGAIVPLEMYGSEARVHTIMIEVNRTLYLDETTGRQLATFPLVRARLASLIRELAEATPA